MSEDEVLVCPYCRTILERNTLYRQNCICVECGAFLDIDEIDFRWEGYDMYDQDYYDNFWDSRLTEEDVEILKDKVEEEEEEEEEEIMTLQMRFVTSADMESIKKAIEYLNGDIEFMFCESNGLIKQFCKTSPGEKLCRGLNLSVEKDKLEEYYGTVSFIMESKDDRVKIISTFSNVFPLCILREEGSKYIMANNKGLAKGIADICNTKVTLMSEFITPYEKFNLLRYYLYWCDPYKSRNASDIYIKWHGDALISLAVLRERKHPKSEWCDFLAESDVLLVSAHKDDSGSWVSFDTIVEKCYEKQENDLMYDEVGDIIELITLRGTSEYSIMAKKEEQ